MKQTVFALLLALCATLSHAQNEDVVASIVLLKEVSKPVDLDLSIAQQYLDAEDYKAAQKVINEYKKKYPNSEQLILFDGKILLNREKYNKAIDEFDRVLMINPSNSEAYYLRGLTRDLDGDHVNAIVDFTQAITINPKYSVAFEARGTSRSVAGDNFGAIEDYTQALELNPNLKFAFKGRGIAYHKTGQHQKAIEDFNEVLRDSSGKEGLVVYYRGMSKIKSGDKRGGCRDLSRAYTNGMGGAAKDLSNYCQ